MQEIRPRLLKNQLRIKADIRSVGATQEFVQGVLRGAAAPDKFIAKVRLILDEAVANAIEHGGIKSVNDMICVSCELVKGSFRLQVEDFQGRMFDPEYFRRIAGAKDWGKGGRGIMVIEQVVDHMMYLIEVGKHTILHMEMAAPWYTGEEKNPPDHPRDKGDQPAASATPASS